MTFISRRNFLKALGAGTVALSGIENLQQAFASATPGSFLPASVQTRDDVHHVIQRLTFGATDNLLQQVRETGVDAFIEQQLNPETIDNSTFDTAYASEFPDLGWSVAELYAQALEDERALPQTSTQLSGDRFARAMYSERQLYERMVHFWGDHFNVYAGNRLAYLLKPTDERDVIRRHAMGNFRDMLGASAHSPAMLYYLDNATSSREAPNENYARELLELHTMGVDGGYTEDDVKEVARCFTGWSFIPPGRAGENERFAGMAGEFFFNRRAHDDGEKVVLGQVIPAGGGEADGEMVLDILATHPSTARFISSKLIRRFVADVPPETLVQVCADVFLRTSGNIREILRTIFASSEFWQAPPKFKRPFEYIISAMRPLNYEISLRRFVFSLSPVLENLGHVPFRRPSPDGYPDIQAFWQSNLLMRWNVAIAAAHSDIPGTQYNVGTILSENAIPLEPQPIINFMAEMLYGRALTADESRVIFDHVNSGNGNRAYIADGLALLMAAPAYQYR